MQPLQFGLTGREFQDSFNVEKYEAIAYMQHRGIEMLKLVVDNWIKWVDIVEDSRWLKSWKHSNYCKQSVWAPGEILILDYSSGGNVPLAIFSSAIWGFGVERWAPVATDTDGGQLRGRGKSNEPAKTILQLRGVTKPNSYQSSLWDDKLYRGCGMLLPVEYGELDRWLEPMWRYVCLG